MKKELTYNTNEEYFVVKKALEKDGYKKTSDCFWCQIFEKDNQMILTSRINHYYK